MDVRLKSEIKCIDQKDEEKIEMKEQLEQYVKEFSEIPFQIILRVCEGSQGVKINNPEEYIKTFKFRKDSQNIYPELNQLRALKQRVPEANSNDLALFRFCQLKKLDEDVTTEFLLHHAGKYKNQTHLHNAFSDFYNDYTNQKINFYEMYKNSVLNQSVNKTIQKKKINAIRKRPTQAETVKTYTMPKQSNELIIEQNILGSLLLDNKLYDNSIKIDDFSLPAHSYIYIAIQRIIFHNKDANVVSVFEELKKNGYADSTGGLQYIDKIARNADTENYPSYLTIFKNMAKKRTSRIREELVERVKEKDVNTSMGIIKLLLIEKGKHDIAINKLNTTVSNIVKKLESYEKILEKIDKK